MATRQPVSEEDIEKMRLIVNQHDRKSTSEIAEFDLNKPPQRKYVFQEFPKLMYKHDTRATRKANDQAEQEALESSGFQAEPFAAEVDETPELDAESARELRKVEKALAVARSKA